MSRSGGVDRGLLALLLVGLGAPLAVFVGAARFGPDTPFLLQDAEAAWIGGEVRSLWQSPLPNDSPGLEARFTRRFELASVPREARLEIRALRIFEAVLNGQRVLSGESCLKRWCEARVEPWLRAGTNELSVDVTNRAGPPLLQLRLNGGALDLRSDADFRVASARGSAAASLADDRVPPIRVPRALPSPLGALRDRWGTLLLFFVVSVLLFAASARLPAPWRERTPELAALGLALGWLAIFVAKVIDIPLTYGADGPAHVRTVRLILDRGALPLASEGFQAYQPPLYYALTAALLAIVEPVRGGATDRALLKLVPFLSSLASIPLARALAARLFPGDTTLRLLAVVLAGTLPANLSNASYPSNEPLHAALAGAALLVTTYIVLDGQATPRRLATLGAVLGAALLTKYTALLVALLTLGFVGYRVLVIDRRGTAAAIATTAVPAALALALSGWVYARNWLNFGDPFVWNLDGVLGFRYWQPPGYHTLPFFTSFGDVLRQPYYAAFRSLWDGLYSTTWGEGSLPGGHTFQAPHAQWNYALMSAGYALALPMTALGALGLFRAVRTALRDADAGRRAAFALQVLFVLAFVASLATTILQFPAWNAVRAKYVLAAALPAMCFAAFGCRTADRWLSGPRLAAARAAFWGWIGTLFATCLGAFAG